MNNQHDELTQVFGEGWGFPLRFNLKPTSSNEKPGAASAVVMSAGAGNVAQSLALLFQTQPGERIMRASYGCDFQSAMFANLSDSMLVALRNRIAESVANHEPRAEGVTVDMEALLKPQGMLRVVVTYRLAGLEQRLQGHVNVLEGVEEGGVWAMSLW
ncbi:GPW/gp25 family protein [Serratia bockelmannii]|uniref:GPW/gp25 family protein n=1 Tax=Serratia bockelmannii TaxID=2703793 RepID=UPI003FA6E253